MTNIELFEYSGRHPEPIIDPYYNHDTVIIPDTEAESNELVKGNSRLIELITVFGYLRKQGKTKDDSSMKEVLSEVCEILVKIEGINFSPLSQFIGELVK